MSEGQVDRSPDPLAAGPADRHYWILTVEGALQGVGFRAFVHRLANEEGIAGDVRHAGEGAALQLHGSRPALERFRERLGAELPSAARIDAYGVFHAGEGAGWIREFRIVEDPSYGALRGSISVVADRAAGGRS